ncbi:lasso peptide biosynthesis B2 protein [Xanthomonas prunicola]|uniref:Lasso peptide biosynthesis B2 protein n=1 Tax=Xanthomonas prunicola TaxID=2053930 RepID=A0A9Q9J2S3_9XANT|nr:lasso peptide biosynthesis B2 protein [Xanthomonas prunicola]USJ02802.1 lasso peptide biosynthesis B2 protein [Xanthomonas prunicola]UXA51126.1 lasso peptide biosynthesis B2 protein [Xanthomonas prunicola]UXA59367.1 lasso peptide biosynthesis B2 protein [Xanthomonas prunicola]UXA63570.1 lasso peptide biosynthesis B2 protein [Xanthomonas prunicola]UXA67566.1 lasso peptide biosynthesis B2 protein [Xanthomonas prunicola]
MPATVARCRRMLAAFGRLPRFERLLLVPAWILLGLARAAVRWLGFRRLAHWVGDQVAVPPALPRLDTRAQRRAMQIGRTVRLAARHTPWDSNCLAQALAAHYLLGLFRVAHLLCLGVTHSDDDGQLQAHAWVLAGSTRVTGGRTAERFTRVGCFVPRAWRAR